MRLQLHYNRCDKPLEVCFLLNETGEHSIAKGRARPVSVSEAAAIVRKADEYGLIHLTLYQPDHEIYSLCNCCPCCCHDLQFMKVYNRRDLVVRSEYVAVTDKDSCINCGKCIERCIFDARTFGDGQMRYNSGLCLGCGLCVTVCQEHATIMQPWDPWYEKKGVLEFTAQQLVGIITGMGDEWISPHLSLVGDDQEYRDQNHEGK